MKNRNNIEVKEFGRLLSFLVLFLIISCSSVETNTFGSEVPFYQDYKVTYYKDNGKLKAQATFRKKNKDGSRLELELPSKILCNEITGPWTRLDNYFYNWNFEDKVDANFTLTNNKGKELKNKILFSEISDITIPDSFKTLKLNESTVFTWEGDELKDREFVRVQFSQDGKYSSNSLIYAQNIGDKSITLTKASLSELKPGEATFEVYRELTKDLEVEDADAGGRRIVAVTTKKKVILE